MVDFAAISGAFDDIRRNFDAANKAQTNLAVQKAQLANQAPLGFQMEFGEGAFGGLTAELKHVGLNDPRIQTELEVVRERLRVQAAQNADNLEFKAKLDEENRNFELQVSELNFIRDEQNRLIRGLETRQIRPGDFEQRWRNLAQRASGLPTKFHTFVGPSFDAQLPGSFPTTQQTTVEDVTQPTSITVGGTLEADLPGGTPRTPGNPLPIPEGASELEQFEALVGGNRQIANILTGQGGIRPQDVQRALGNTDTTDTDAVIATLADQFRIPPSLFGNVQREDKSPEGIFDAEVAEEKVGALLRGSFLTEVENRLQNNTDAAGNLAPIDSNIEVEVNEESGSVGITVDKFDTDDPAIPQLQALVDTYIQQFQSRFTDPTTARSVFKRSLRDVKGARDQLRDIIKEFRGQVRNNTLILRPREAVNFQEIDADPSQPDKVIFNASTQEQRLSPKDRGGVAPFKPTSGITGRPSRSGRAAQSLDINAARALAEGFALLTGQDIIQVDIIPGQNLAGIGENPNAPTDPDLVTITDSQGRTRQVQRQTRGRGIFSIPLRIVQ